MEFVGEHLKKSRLNKKISLKTVVKDLHINLDLLKRIENNDFSSNLRLVYFIGHIRAYAKYLGLNDNEIVKQFKNQNSIDKSDLIDKLPKPLETSNFNFVTQTFSIFSIIFISFGFYFLFVRTNDLYPSYSILPDLPESLKSEIEEIEIQSTLESVKKIASVDSINEIPTSTSIDTTINDNFFGNESSVIASVPKNKLSKSKNIITLKFLNSTWIQLRNKQDQIVLSKLMSGNDEYSYSIVDNLTLTSGDAGNILVLINGQTRGKAGKKGEVIDSMVINSDFDN